MRRVTRPTDAAFEARSARASGEEAGESDEDEAIDGGEEVDLWHVLADDIEQRKGGEEHGEDVGNAVREEVRLDEVDEHIGEREADQRRDDLGNVVAILARDVEGDGEGGDGEARWIRGSAQFGAARFDLPLGDLAAKEHEQRIALVWSVDGLQAIRLASRQRAVA